MCTGGEAWYTYHVCVIARGPDLTQNHVEVIRMSLYAYFVQQLLLAVCSSRW